MRGEGSPVASSAAPAATADGGAAGFSADDLERARASFRVLLETACCLLPAPDAPEVGPTTTETAAPTSSAAAGGLQPSILLLLTRLCEEGWAPELLAEMIVASEKHREKFLLKAARENEELQH